MLLQPECIPCTLNMAIRAMRRLAVSEGSIQELISRVLAIPALRGPDWSTMPPEVVESIVLEIVDLAGDPDPFISMKAEQNSAALGLYPWLRELIEKAPNPLYTAVSLSIIGNSVDAMKYQQSMNLKSLVQERLIYGISEEAFSMLMHKMAGSSLLVYLADNCGEVVFDKVFIETLKERFKNLEIVYVVRSQPALNDVTLNEALVMGMDKIATVMENGLEGPLPGTILKRCSSEMRNLVGGADLIISKGGGNFDSLSEERLNKDVSFMLLSKCVPYCEQFQTTLNAPVLENRYV